MDSHNADKAVVAVCLSNGEILVFTLKVHNGLMTTILSSRGAWRRRGPRGRGGGVVAVASVGVSYPLTIGSDHDADQHVLVGTAWPDWMAESGRPPSRLRPSGGV